MENIEKLREIENQVEVNHKELREIKKHLVKIEGMLQQIIAISNKNPRPPFPSIYGPGPGGEGPYPRL